MANVSRRRERTPRGVERAAGRTRHRAAWNGVLAPGSSPHAPGHAGQAERTLARRRRANRTARASRRANRTE